MITDVHHPCETSLQALEGTLVGTAKKDTLQYRSLQGPIALGIWETTLWASLSRDIMFRSLSLSSGRGLAPPQEMKRPWVILRTRGPDLRILKHFVRLQKPISSQLLGAGAPACRSNAPFPTSTSDSAPMEIWSAPEWYGCE